MSIDEFPKIAFKSAVFFLYSFNSNLYADPIQTTAQSANSAFYIHEAEIHQTLQSHKKTIEELPGRTYAYQLDPLNTHQKKLTCAEPLEFQVINPTQILRKQNLKITCAKPTWHEYLAFYPKISQKLVTASVAIAAGTPITAAQVKIAEWDGNKLYGSQYFTDIEQVKNLVASRPIMPDQALNPRIVTTPKAIIKDDLVEIWFQNKHIHVKTKGKALESGHIGSLIKVQNISTQKIVQAEIIKKGEVKAI
jgi:flagella basal body P-ring formation protein FlgA